MQYSVVESISVVTNAGHNIMIMADASVIGDPKDTLDGGFFGRKSF